MKANGESWDGVPVALTAVNIGKCHLPHTPKGVNLTSAGNLFN